MTERQHPVAAIADLLVLRDLAAEVGSRHALTVLADAAAAGGQQLPVPELPPPASYEEMLGGTVTVWVDRGVAIRRGIGYPDRVIGSGFFIDRDGGVRGLFTPLHPAVGTPRRTRAGQGGGV